MEVSGHIYRALVFHPSPLLLEDSPKVKDWLELYSYSCTAYRFREENHPLSELSRVQIRDTIKLFRWEVRQKGALLEVDAEVLAYIGLYTSVLRNGLVILTGVLDVLLESVH